MKNNLILVAILMTVAIPSVWALKTVQLPVDESKNPLTGEGFDLETGKKIFDFSRTQKKEGSKLVAERKFKDLGGKVLVEEWVEYDDRRLKSFKIKYHQTGQEGLVEIKNDKIFFTYKNSQSAVDKNDEDLEENTIIGEQIPSFIKSQWASIVKGDTQKIRLIVPHRTETVGFHLLKDKVVNQDGKEVTIVKMRAGSIFIRAIVDPLYFYFDASDPKNIHLVEYRGRTQPKKKTSSGYGDLDARTIYQ